MLRNCHEGYLKEMNMKKFVIRGCTVLAAVLFLSITVLELTAEARAGGSRSSGSRGSRSYSKPAQPLFPAETAAAGCYGPRRSSAASRAAVS